MNTLEFYLGLFHPMQAGHARRTLETKTAINGKNSLPRHVHIENLVASGGKVRDTKSFGRVLESKNGAFLAKDQITKAAIDYASFLISRNDK